MTAVFSRHFWITRGVARSMGLDLGKAVDTGALSVDRYEEMVTRCANCALVENCIEWLARPQNCASTPPPGCAISDSLVRLSRLQRRR